MAELQIIKYDCLVNKILIEINTKPSSGFDGHWNIAPLPALYNSKAATSRDYGFYYFMVAMQGIEPRTLRI